MIENKTPDQSTTQDVPMETVAPVQTETPVTVPSAPSAPSASATESAPLRTVKVNFLDKIKFDKWKGWIYLLPALVLLAIFTVWPIINTIRVAFLNDYNMLKASYTKYEFGIQNFITVLENGDVFLTGLKNTMLLCVLTVPISIFLALLIAVALNSIKPLQKLFQTIFFLPYVTNSIAIGMVFAALFKMTGSGNMIDNVGFINSIIVAFGGKPINWVNPESGYWANITVLVVYIVWNALPFKILVLLGGLQGINKQYYEAAMIDSTPRWRVFTRITVPLLSPMIAYLVITSFIGGFKEYSSVVGIFGEKMGPLGNGEMMTMVGYIYNQDVLPMGFTGEASAAALILFAIIFVVTMINLYVSKKKTHF